MTALEWIESLSPWPVEGFGLARMRALLAELGDPQLAYPSIHVVGTNGKGTTARTVEETLVREGLRVGCTTSPHVTGWAERIRVLGREADFESAVERVRPAAERVGATQFEAITAAALAAFADATVEVASVEAGLGGRHDATNVLRSPVQALTNVSLEHTEVLGPTRDAIAREKLAVVQAGATVVLGEPEWEGLALEAGAGRVVVETGGNLALAAAAASAFLGREVEPAEVSLPGRLERVDGLVLDGAHNPAGVRWLLDRLPEPEVVLVASILRDRDAREMLALFAARASALVATESSNPRALPAQELGERGRSLFWRVEIEPDPLAAVARGRELAGENGTVLVSGSLYLLADLAGVRAGDLPWESSASG
jgi:dihydrofolate synthase/folylpolyglutamate synthase